MVEFFVQLLVDHQSLLTKLENSLLVQNLVRAHSHDGKNDLVNIFTQFRGTGIQAIAFDTRVNLVLKVTASHTHLLQNRLQTLIVILHRCGAFSLRQLAEYLYLYYKTTYFSSLNFVTQFSSIDISSVNFITNCVNSGKICGKSILAMYFTMSK